MKVGILGSGIVAQTLAAGFVAHGHAVLLGTRSPEKLADWQQVNPGVRLGTVAEAGAFGSVLVLAVKGTVAQQVLEQAGGQSLGAKVVLDATNPIADAAPVNGVLRYFTSLDESLMERLQKAFPALRLVKAFNSVGSALMVNPELAGGRPSMFICGNDTGARNTVTEILDQFGWDTVDMGLAEAARAIEPLAMLWCIPGFLRNDWKHAFKVLA
ncbi:MAG: NAD(P)-binding domain-containing protein [Calditrichaeota bacterium]|nr:NAD(P)-binding domain-containing protein [Candidatus Cloacimonadota bacterium]MCA9787221.1 NAD(P)-binding domain-containing protein [Candidatus Cloacimonadota bacterium]MCB1047927.1 NAD(P)-binding domain-containing protein [Calditrichota bacterium]MCB9474271.1 NAD(P)-binding domain-containing protein [Candidatus Delongbacteria bacterium]